MEKISVIVPVYNAEKYLSQCLDSLLHQTYDNMEVIVVDDGSSDASLAICEHFAKKSSKFRIITGKNYGVSHARNIGMRMASGTYMTFVDADDYLVSSAIARMAYQMQNHDMCVCAHARIFKNYTSRAVVGGPSEYTRYGMLKRVLVQGKVEGFLWNKMFRMDIIRYYNLQMDKTITLGEDLLFVCKYLMYCDDIVYIKDILYMYRMRKGSLCKGFDKAQYTLLDSMLKIIDVLEDESLIAHMKWQYVVSCFTYAQGIPNSRKSYYETYRKQFMDEVSFVKKGILRSGCYKPIIQLWKKSIKEGEEFWD